MGESNLTVTTPATPTAREPVHTDMRTIEVVAGTRPEAIKVAPLVTELRANWARSLRTCVVATGQHPEMVIDAFHHFGVDVDDHFSLERTNDRIAGLAGPLTGLFDEHFARTRPQAVVVQGDTTSALVAAQVAHWHAIPVVHLEAGLRTGELGNPFPEEANRRGIAAVASLHLAPTDQAADNLLREGIDPAHIVVTGNTVVDAVCSVVGQGLVWPYRPMPHLPSGPVVVTVHRRESWGRGLVRLCAAVGELARRHPAIGFVWPVHPGTEVHAVVHQALAGVANVALDAPLPYPEMMRLLAGARLVLTDSGGLQEEAAALGVPALVLRRRTERPEGIAIGAAALVGTDPERVVATADEVLSCPGAWRSMAGAGCPYGDGAAAPRAAQAIVDAVIEVQTLPSSSTLDGPPEPVSTRRDAMAILGATG